MNRMDDILWLFSCFVQLYTTVLADICVLFSVLFSVKSCVNGVILIFTISIIDKIFNIDIISIDLYNLY